MKKETFIEMIQWLRVWKRHIDDFATMLNVDSPYESPLFPMDNFIDQMCAVSGYDEEIKFSIFQLVWDGYVEIDCDDCNGTHTSLKVDEEDYYNIFLDTRKL